MRTLLTVFSFAVLLALAGCGSKSAATIPESISTQGWENTCDGSPPFGIWYFDKDLDDLVAAITLNKESNEFNIAYYAEGLNKRFLPDFLKTITVDVGEQRFAFKIGGDMFFGNRADLASSPAFTKALSSADHLTITATTRKGTTSTLTVPNSGFQHAMTSECVPRNFPENVKTALARQEKQRKARGSVDAEVDGTTGDCSAFEGYEEARTYCQKGKLDFAYGSRARARKAEGDLAGATEDFNKSAEYGNE